MVCSLAAFGEHVRYEVEAQVPTGVLMEYAPVPDLVTVTLDGYTSAIVQGVDEHTAVAVPKICWI